jgi:excisionase family DNA binding protein
MIIPPAPALYSVKAAAAILSLGLTKTWEMVKSQQLETVLIGRRRLIKADSLYALIEKGAAD